ncbi:CRISPR-associated endoribonuclease Cas6 [Halonatronum saccharophilum]|uniref:CRISPR-associated endoribonuclease Cas6 n=1 Tax=Halonatronum saccharophilum TaxID=150060 RepID=UPI0004802807|nr:CRISPR-associated endoribonuclease Cas6 [Halonatronum saccharophilum]
MLYSVIIRFEVKKEGSIKYYPGEALHGMFFNILAQVDEQKATLLHDEYDTKAFTVSPILPYPRFKKGRRVLEGGKEYFFRITFLEDEWYLLFIDHFLYNGSKLSLQGVEIEVIEVLTTSNDDKRCNAIEYKELRERSSSNRRIDLQFHSTTTFRVGDKHIIFPMPEYLFYNLLKKWEEFSSIELSLELEDFEKVYASRYKLESTMETFKRYRIKGFRGECQYEIDLCLSKDKVRDINLLVDFAFYCGVGYKSTMGLGQVARKSG